MGVEGGRERGAGRTLNSITTPALSLSPSSAISGVWPFRRCGSASLPFQGQVACHEGNVRSERLRDPIWSPFASSESRGSCIRIMDAQASDLEAANHYF